MAILTGFLRSILGAVSVLSCFWLQELKKRITPDKMETKSHFINTCILSKIPSYWPKSQESVPWEQLL